jgi:hypothetical protein
MTRLKRGIYASYTERRSLRYTERGSLSYTDRERVTDAESSAKELFEVKSATDFELMVYNYSIN